MAYGLHRRGCRVWADDTLVFDASAEIVQAIPYPHRLRIRAEAAEYFDHELRRRDTRAGPRSNRPRRSRRRWRASSCSSATSKRARRSRRSGSPRHRRWPGSWSTPTFPARRRRANTTDDQEVPRAGDAGARVPDAVSGALDQLRTCSIRPNRSYEQWRASHDSARKAWQCGASYVASAPGDAWLLARMLAWRTVLPC